VPAPAGSAAARRGRVSVLAELGPEQQALAGRRWEVQRPHVRDEVPLSQAAREAQVPLRTRNAGWSATGPAVWPRWLDQISVQSPAPLTVQPSSSPWNCARTFGSGQSRTKPGNRAIATPKRYRSALQPARSRTSDSFDNSGQEPCRSPSLIEATTTLLSPQFARIAVSANGRRRPR